MSEDDLNFHRDRERHCRELAQSSEDPDVARLHEELADMHASEAARYGSDEL